MAKKKNDTEKPESTTGKAPKSTAGRKKKTTPTPSGEVKGPKGVGTKPKGKGKMESKPTSPPSEESPKNLPKPKMALPEKGSPDRPPASDPQKSPAREKQGKVSSKKKGGTSGTEKATRGKAGGTGRSTGSSQTKAPKDSSVEDKENQEQARPAKKMSRQKADPAISAEEKMKLPNTSPSEDLKETLKVTAEELKKKFLPDDQTKQQFENLVKNLIPDPKDVQDAPEKLNRLLATAPEKAREWLEKVVPDPETAAMIMQRAKEMMEDKKGPSGEREPSSAEKPVEATLLSDFDIHLFKEGKHFHLYKKLGAHPMEYMGTQGVYFALWAPNAESVSVIGDFNNWDRERHPMNARWDHSGIWEVFIPEAKKGSLYKYFIRGHNGYEVEKGDPFAFLWETPPQTASVVWDLENTWNDSNWMKQRQQSAQDPQPVSVYELHLGSWKRVLEDNLRSLTYRELARDLPGYLNEMGFTHVEFMPVMEHPFFGSWGYQITGYFAPSSRFGTPQDFMHLIDRLHQAGIGVILDWVPSHFPSDLHGLHYFDGTHLYEHSDPQKGFHPDWQSYIFNYGRNEVRSFLISNALFWLDHFHVDGLRVDAVASMLYLDYSRKEGEWQPNEEGGRENLEAIAFLKEFNEVVYREYPDTMTIAEESTAWPMVSRPTYMGGLGFGLKWMMGWMHDTLEYFSKDPVHRRHHQNTITFSTTYAFTENFMLPLSHDEVVYGKQSILNKMPGDAWNKFANLRTLYSYMFAHPGAKLLFMGAEFAQDAEWNHDSSLEWHLTEQPAHRQIQETLKELNRLYRSEPALYEKAYSQEGFEWVDIKDEENSIISFLRKGENPDEHIMVICNFTPVPRENYRLGVPRPGKWKEIFNSDDKRFGGSDVSNQGVLDTQELPAHNREFSLSLTLPPMAVIYLKRT